MALKHDSRDSTETQSLRFVLRAYFTDLLLRFSCTANFTNGQVDRQLLRTLHRKSFTGDSKFERARINLLESAERAAKLLSLWHDYHS